jgi:hypothetical protein
MAEAASEIGLGRRRLTALLSGALWWRARRTLVFADLHFEKGSSFAARGALLPPYDTRETLLRMTIEIDRLDPAHVICLGDSFHDGEAWSRMHAEDAGLLAALAHRRRWTWVAGNHDPAPPACIGDEVVERLDIDGVEFLHQANGTPARDISGHFHPKAFLRGRGGALARPCFVEDGARIVLPAFGAYAGGLDIADGAIAALFPAGGVAHVLGRTRVVRLPLSGATAAACVRAVTRSR